jgi:hypothetical protein
LQTCEDLRGEIERLGHHRHEPASTPLLPVHALSLALRGERCEEVAPLVERAYADPRDANTLSSQQMLVGFSGYALVYADELSAAKRFADSVAAYAERSASLAAFITASLHRAVICLRTAVGLPGARGRRARRTQSGHR